MKKTLAQLVMERRKQLQDQSRFKHEICDSYANAAKVDFAAVLDRHLNKIGVEA